MPFSYLSISIEIETMSSSNRSTGACVWLLYRYIDSAGRLINIIIVIMAQGEKRRRIPDGVQPTKSDSQTSIYIPVRKRVCWLYRCTTGRPNFPPFYYCYIFYYLQNTVYIRRS